MLLSRDYMTIENTGKPPFDKGFVMRTTFKHMRRSVDISISKSFERLKDFEGDTVMGTEIMETLSVLHQVKKFVDGFEQNNKHLFTSNK